MSTVVHDAGAPPISALDLLRARLLGMHDLTRDEVDAVVAALSAPPSAGG